MLWWCGQQHEEEEEEVDDDVHFGLARAYKLLLCHIYFDEVVYANPSTDVMLVVGQHPLFDVVVV